MMRVERLRRAAVGWRGSVSRTARRASAAMLLLLVSLSLPTRAFADWTTSSTVETGINAAGESYLTVTGGPVNSNLYAAARAVGYSDSEIQGWNATIRAKLSNASTGGDFYVFASTFSDGTGVLGWVGEGFKLFLGNLETLYGSALYSRTWTTVDWDPGLRTSARDDARVIVNGGSLGGGGVGDTLTVYPNFSFRSAAVSGSPTRGYTTWQYGSAYYTGRMKADGTAYGSDQTLLTTPVSILLPDDFNLGLPTGYSNSDVCCYVSTGNLDSRMLIHFMIVPSLEGVSFSGVTISSATGVSKSFVYCDDATVQYVGMRQISFTVASFDGTTMVCSDWHGDTGWGAASSKSVAKSESLAYGVFGGASTIPTLPPNNWPDNEIGTNPEPPEVPEPDDGDVVAPEPPDLPTPYEPIVDPTTPEPDPTPTPTPTPTYPTVDAGTDYTPYLRAIINRLETINNTLVTLGNNLANWLTNHCKHIRDQIDSSATWLGDKVENVVSNGLVGFERWLQGTWTGYLLDEYDYVIGQQIGELEDYLHDLFVWLADQMEFTFTGGGEVYDDSSLLVWLKRIYSRLGSGGPSVGNGDDVDDGFDFWTWLYNLIVNRLGSVVGDIVSGCAGLLDALRGTFPFSIPWDIAAYISLLTANRVVPVVTITIPAVEGWWGAISYVIDLTPYDGTMATVRAMVLIWWGFVLVMKTDWLGKVFDGAVDSVGRFVRGLAG